MPKCVKCVWLKVHREVYKKCAKSVQKCAKNCVTTIVAPGQY